MSEPPAGSVQPLDTHVLTRTVQVRTHLAPLAGHLAGSPPRPPPVHPMLTEWS